MSASDTPKGFTCECGKEHEFSLYVYSHWDIQLVHSCEACGREHTILRGRAYLTGHADMNKDD